MLKIQQGGVVMDQESKKVLSVVILVILLTIGVLYLLGK
jgi:hypothetical protein